jgi:hypothetical protein
MPETGNHRKGFGALERGSQGEWPSRPDPDSETSLNGIKEALIAARDGNLKTIQPIACFLPSFVS